MEVFVPRFWRGFARLWPPHSSRCCDPFQSWWGEFLMGFYPPAISLQFSPLCSGNTRLNKQTSHKDEMPASPSCRHCQCLPASSFLQAPLNFNIDSFKHSPTHTHTHSPSSFSRNMALDVDDLLFFTVSGWAVRGGRW